VVAGHDPIEALPVEQARQGVAIGAAALEAGIHRHALVGSPLLYDLEHRHRLGGLPGNRAV
jgi:hypothetical protein